MPIPKLSRPRPTRSPRPFAAALPLAAALALGCGPGETPSTAAPGGAPPAADTAAPRDPAAQPYEVAAQAWRNQQPGGEPRLIVSARFALRPGAQPWGAVQLGTLELRAGEQRWKPAEQVLEMLPEGGFELRAQGEPTLAEGAQVTLYAQLQTDGGSREVEVPAGSIYVAE